MTERALELLALPEDCSDLLILVSPLLMDGCCCMCLMFVPVLFGFFFGGGGLVLTF